MGLKFNLIKEVSHLPLRKDKKQFFSLLTFLAFIHLPYRKDKKLIIV